jgi:hypothetical protein
MELVALLSKGEGTWGQVAGLMKKGEWEKITLVGNSFANQNFSCPEISFDFIEVDLEKALVPLKTEFLKKFEGKIQALEVALSVASGSGKEHMALVSALLSIPVGVRFTALTKDGIVFL